MSQEERSEYQEQGEQTPKRISDVSGRGVLEGEAIGLETILGEDVVISGFAWRDSQFEGREHYLVVQIIRDDKRYVFTTGSQVVIDTFERVTPEQLPLIGKFEQIKGKAGRKYLRVV